MNFRFSFFRKYLHQNREGPLAHGFSRKDGRKRFLAQSTSPHQFAQRKLGHLRNRAVHDHRLSELGVHRSTGTTIARRIRIRSSVSSATTMLPSSMPKRWRNFAGTAIAAYCPTLAHCIIRLPLSECPVIYHAQYSGNLPSANYFISASCTASYAGFFW